MITSEGRDQDLVLRMLCCERVSKQCIDPEWLYGLVYCFSPVLIPTTSTEDQYIQEGVE